MNNVEVLILSNTLDFGTDLITIELERRNVCYFRINRDKFNEYKITFDIQKKELILGCKEEKYSITEENLRSIYYRAPIYLRDIYKPGINESQQLYRTQWSAFIRNLTFFEWPRWINNPIHTFKAENKFLQLKYAEEIGFCIPQSLITNCIDDIEFEEMIVKSIDTAQFMKNSNNAFVYSNIINIKELTNDNLSELPIMAQQLINPKEDIRVTIIGEKVFAVKILNKGKGIKGDWRKKKEQLDYVLIQLPLDIKERCIEITKRFNLNFAGIDLAKSESEYYFIEVNPTGEWAWLNNSKNINIDTEICKFLIKN